MFFRCTHDNFGNSRCNGEPDWVDDGKEIISGQLITQDRQCKLNPETCGRLLHIEEVVNLKASWLEKPTFVENIIPIKSNNENKDGSKVLSKKAKKLESELAQGNMF